jgi:hypothetical protein
MARNPSMPWTVRSPQRPGEALVWEREKTSFSVPTAYQG